ncbi:Hypothetical predicted protein [Paramuricea clavata]|uniref:Uncharacterized protein n=1 Tax=Paramuricea clavata TaxID=317549 RepID=A0A6S7JIV1_PARCT|nr:Hypothetical predicted protein [Paramuricea clavata]
MSNLELDRYIVFIANIPDEVTMNCFLFQIKEGQLPVKYGEFKVLHGNSPLRLNEKVLQNVHSGAESFNQITRFEKKMKYIRNKDATENLDISNKNENETSSYTVGNRVQHVTSVSVEREKTKNRYTQEHTTGITKKLDKDNHTPTPDRPSPRHPGFTGYGSQDIKQKINTTASNGCTIQTNQRDPEQNNQSNRGRVTEQSTSATRNGLKLSSTPHSSWQPQDNKTTTPTTSDRGEKNENFQTILKNTQKQQEHQGTTPKTNKQASERNSNFPTASQGMQKQWTDKEKTPTTSDRDAKYYNYPTTPEDRKGQREHQCSRSYEYQTTPKDKQKQRHLKETTPKSSESGKLASTSQKQREQHIDGVGKKDRYPNTRRTTEGAQHLQSPSVKYKGSDGRAMNVIVNQPLGFGGSGSLKRKSGDYDNVKGHIELPQRKSSRLNSDYIPPSHDTPEVIHERSSIPSGTFKPPEVRHKIKQTGEISDIETTRSSWTRWYNSVCCRMSKLTRNEPEVEEIGLNKVEDNDGTKVYV